MTRTGSSYIATLRALLDTSDLGPFDWRGTVDGAWSFAAGNLAALVDQRMASAVAAISPDSADIVGLTELGRRLGLSRRAATPTKIGVEVTGTGTVPAGAIAFGFGVQWVVVDVYAPAVGSDLPLPATLTDGEYAVVTGSTVVLDSVSGKREAAPRAGSSAIDFSPAIATIDITLPATSVVSSTLGGVLYAGTDQETIPQYRARLLTGPVRRSGSTPGLRAAVLDLPGVVAVDIETVSPGLGRVQVVGELAAGDLVDIAQEVYDASPAFTVFDGATFYSIQGADGRPATVRLSTGTEEEVPMVVSLVLDGTISGADAETAARAAIEQVFAGLSVGDPIRYLRVLAALDVPGIVGATVQLDGGQADIYPDAVTSVLVPERPIPITSAPET